MSQYKHTPFEIHVHGEIPLQPNTTAAEVQHALKPLWQYAGAHSFNDGAESVYEDEPGIRFDAQQNQLHICWTVRGNEDFRQNIDEMCMNLNELASAGAPIEVTFYDAEYAEDDEPRDEDESRDDFIIVFVGPTPAAIMKVQRDLLVHDVSNLMERHFDPTELSGVIHEIDQLFSKRFDALAESLELGKPPKGFTETKLMNRNTGHNKPKHLH